MTDQSSLNMDRRTALQAAGVLAVSGLTSSLAGAAEKPRSLPKTYRAVVGVRVGKIFADIVESHSGRGQRSAMGSTAAFRGGRGSNIYGNANNHHYDDEFGWIIKKLAELQAAKKIDALIDERRFKGLDSVKDAVPYTYGGGNLGKVIVTI